jgi:hypothetical protein
MKMQVVTEIPPIDTLGSLEVAEVYSERHVLLDGKRAPPMLERLILIGLDVQTEQYRKTIEDLMIMEQRLLEGK